MTKQLINAAVKAIESGKTRSEFVKARKSVKESVSSRAWYVAEPIVDPSLKFEATVGSVAKARKSGMRWERIAARTDKPVSELTKLAKKSKQAKSLEYTGKGTKNVKSLA